MINSLQIKQDFPIFERKMNGQRLVYLDNAATTQKPQVVLDKVVKFYETMNANTHRGVHALSEQSTEAYEGVRKNVAKFINAKENAEIIFTCGTTDSINLVAATWGEQNISKGDEVVVSIYEHNSNMIPWQQLCDRKGAELKFLDIGDDGELKLDAITEKTKLVAVTGMSNALGTLLPVEDIVRRTKEVGARFLLDGAQYVPHVRTNVLELDIDFLAFSSHKMLGPTGVGILYGKRELLDEMSPYKYGGEMIKEVTKGSSTWNDLPWKFEAGTQNIAGVVGFGAALQYLDKIGFDEIPMHDQGLVKYAYSQLKELPGIDIYSPEESNGGIVTFNVANVHPHDVGSVLSEEGICIRTGQHCAHPLMQNIGVNAAARMSFYLYNTKEDIDAAVLALKKVYKIFRI